MQRTIRGKIYDTDTAEKICDVSANHGLGYYDFAYDKTHLYRTAKGNWFIAGEGGPMSQWKEVIRPGQVTNGEGIVPVSPDEAWRLLERHANHLVTKFFPTEAA